MFIRIRWYLTHWNHYMRDRENLLERERREASMFFTCLKRMAPEAVQTLSEKYVTDRPASYDNLSGLYLSDLPNSDKKMAELKGVSFSEYRKQRIKYENDLTHLMREEANKRENAAKSKLTHFKLAINRRYLLSYERWGEETLKFTGDPEQATVFSPGPTMNQLERHYGLVRISVEPDIFELEEADRKRSKQKVTKEK